MLSPGFVTDVWEQDEAGCRRYWSDLKRHSDPRIVEKFVAKLIAKREAVSASVYDVVAKVGSPEMADNLSNTCGLRQRVARPFSWFPTVASQMAQRIDNLRAEEVQLREDLERVEGTGNPILIAEAVFDLSKQDLKMARFERAMKGFDRVIELLVDERSHQPFLGKHTRADLIAMMIECARGQRDCLILQGKPEAAREKAFD
jgi:hypothetical protein